MKGLIILILGIALVIFAFHRATVVPDLVPMPERTKPARLMPGTAPKADDPQINVFAPDQRPAELGGPASPPPAAVPPPTSEVSASDAPFVVNGAVRPMPFKLNTEAGPPAPPPKYPVDGKVGHIEAGPFEPKPPGKVGP